MSLSNQTFTYEFDTEADRDAAFQLLKHYLDECREVEWAYAMEIFFAEDPFDIHK